MQDCSELVAHPTGTLESISVRTAVNTLTPPERHGSAPRHEYCPGKRSVQRALPIPEAVSQPEQLLPQIQAAGVHLRDGVLQRLFVCGFTLMGAMVAYFNFLLYRLEAPPFDLTASGAALVFLLYLAGTVSANWLGRLADRRSRRSLLLTAVAMMLGGVLLTLPSYLPTVLIGTGLVTFGFFGAHATTSGWVGAHATHRRAQASSLYLLFYHLGSSLLGFAGGLAYGVGGWNGLVLLVTVAAGVALLAARGLPQLVMPTTRDTVGSEP